MREVTLTKWELAIGAFVGVLRQSESVGRGLKDKAISDMGAWQMHCSGACGELAVAKLLNLYWGCGINTFKAADIGDRIQVRWRAKVDGDLVVRPDDNEEHYYVLVTGENLKYSVWGFMKGVDAKRDEWSANPYGKGQCWFAPRSALHHIDLLPSVLVGDN